MKWNTSATVQVGELYEVEYISDREYVSYPLLLKFPELGLTTVTSFKEVKDFRVMHRVGRFEEPLGGIVDHYISLSAGKTRTQWRVPDLKAGYVALFSRLLLNFMEL
jgi:hypothetical protein